MKNFFYIVLFSVLIGGCNCNSASVAKESEPAGSVKPGETHWDTSGDVNVDTLGLAENLANRAARLQKSNGEYISNSTGGKEINVDTLGLAESIRMRAKTYREQPIEVRASRQETTIKSTNPNRSQNSTSSKKETVAQRSDSGVENKSADDAVAAKSSSDQTKEKKKLSNKTKGAIIGAVSGAAAGAVINKRNRKAGGVIGAILGGAAGYGIGRHKDKKDTAAKGGKQSPDYKK